MYASVQALFCLCFYLDISTSLLSTTWKRKSLSTNLILYKNKGNNEGISGAYEYTGPMDSGVPSEIAAMFNLKKGRKIKKGDGNLKGKRKSSSSSSNGNESNKKHDPDDDALDILERQLISKYGSKTIKESVLTPLDDDDKLFEEKRMASSSRTRFEGFGAKKNADTNTMRDSKYKNDKSDEEDLSEALFKGSRTMSQYITKPSKISASVSEKISTEQNTIDSYKEKKIRSNKMDDSPRHWDFTYSVQLENDSDGDNTGYDNDDDTPNKLALSDKKTSKTINKSNPARGKSNTASTVSSQIRGGPKIVPFFKDDVVSDDSDENDESIHDIYDEEDENDDDLDNFFETESGKMTINRNILHKSQNSNNNMRSISINSRKTSGGSLSGEQLSIDDIFDDDGDYDNNDSYSDNDNDNKKLKNRNNLRVSENYAQKQPEVITNMNTMYRLRAPVPQKESLKEKQNAQLLLNQQKLLEKNQNSKEQKLLQKNEFSLFQFDHNNSNYIDVSENKLFSPTNVQFEDLGVTHEGVLNNLYNKLNIAVPTRIQEMSLPVINSGYDIIMQAHTGSGKSLAFLLPLYQFIDVSKNKIQVVILASSRELVSQIGQVAEALYSDTGIQVQTLIGGANVQNQIIKLKSLKPHIVVATPGRLAELLFKLEKIKLSHVRAVVIDEADQMLQDPYISELETILQSIPMFRQRGRQVSMRTQSASTSPIATTITTSASDDDQIENYIIHNTEKEEEEDIDKEGKSSLLEKDQQIVGNGSLICLASATSTDSDAIKSFANKYMIPNQWKSVIMDKTFLLPPTITHGLISIPRIRALEMLKKFLNSKPVINSAIIFVNDPYRVQVICDQLAEMNIIAAPLHGDSSKEERKDVISKLKTGQIKYLVSTELAARGLDIPELSHVINYELPTDCQHYIHRAGRCGRAGRQGLVMNFANTETKFVVRRFGKQLNVKIMDCEIRSGEVFLKKR